jgi:hypothetical protein
MISKTAALAEKCTEHETSVSFFSTTSVRNIFLSKKI